MTATEGTKGHKNKNQPAPVAYLIDVHVDLAGNFTYSAQGIPDATTIRPRNGDTLSWAVRHGGIPVPFQVEFPGVSPFDSGDQTLRSMFLPTEPQTVNIPSFYHGNRVFKYTVSIHNGWSDDPDVEPVPSDGIEADALKVQTISLSIVNDNLVLTNPDASFVLGQVAWNWLGQALDDFTLTFDAPVPAGWPPETNSQMRKILLNLTTPGSQTYTIQTTNFGLSVKGKLTLTAGPKIHI